MATNKRRQFVIVSQDKLTGIGNLIKLLPTGSQSSCSSSSAQCSATTATATPATRSSRRHSSPLRLLLRLRHLHRQLPGSDGRVPLRDCYHEGASGRLLRLQGCRTFQIQAPVWGLRPCSLRCDLVLFGPLNCLFPALVTSEKTLLMVLPPAIGQSPAFLDVPSTRQGIGYPPTTSDVS
ncbi:hypothetical protein Nepgr_010182 [Nepenthes gracilis]|uniref:Uncharacterized protein n=1 Tax=Nepenthes gracilis TaxID=150966 RepID=A0AAD3SCX7_NEPGR|nr:hypothetical protein Nepgr_010182 [Nepenthes gracilis]